MRGVDIHRHMAGSLRLQSIIDVAQSHTIPLPAWTPEELARKAMGFTEEMIHQALCTALEGAFAPCTDRVRARALLTR